MERRAGASLRPLLRKLTGNNPAGFLKGLGETSVIRGFAAKYDLPHAEVQTNPRKF